MKIYLKTFINDNTKKQFQESPSKMLVEDEVRLKKGRGCRQRGFCDYNLGSKKSVVMNQNNKIHLDKELTRLQLPERPGVRKQASRRNRDDPLI